MVCPPSPKVMQAVVSAEWSQVLNSVTKANSMRQRPVAEQGNTLGDPIYAAANDVPEVTCDVNSAWHFQARHQIFKLAAISRK